MSLHRNGSRPRLRRYLYPVPAYDLASVCQKAASLELGSTERLPKIKVSSFQ